jgi:leucyl-tRNA synthetase
MSNVETTQQEVAEMSLSNTASAVTPGSAGTTVVVKKGTAKRDALRANEIAVQKVWEDMKAFEANPIGTTTTQKKVDDETFMVTFPYPYSNGHLHIGHAYSLTKAIFRAQYERHLGKNVLFPFAFHCTGMPIQAVRLCLLDLFSI